MKRKRLSMLFACALFLSIYSQMPAQPVLHLNFENITNGTVYDQSGAGNNGTIYGRILATNDGAIEKALEFDSTFIKFATGNIFNIDSTLTISFWAKNLDHPRTDYRTIFALSASNCLVIRIAWGYNEKHLFISRNNDATAHDFYVHYTYGFGHYVIVFKGRIIRVYKDGELSEEWDSQIKLALTQNDPTIQCLIGALDTTFLRPLKGILDEFKLHNYALESTEVKNLYASTPFFDYPNLIINSSFEETTVPDFPDRWCSRGGFYPDVNDYRLTLDHETAPNSDGHKSMRFDFNNNNNNFPYDLRYYFGSKWKLLPGNYILSASFKSDPPLNIIMGSDSRGNPTNPGIGTSKEFAATQNWQRDTLRLRFDEKYQRYAFFRLANAQSQPQGSLWIDDVMLHKGTSLQEYKASEVTNIDYGDPVYKFESGSEGQVTGLLLNGHPILPIGLLLDGLKRDVDYKSYDFMDLSVHRCNTIIWVISKETDLPDIDLLNAAPRELEATFIGLRSSLETVIPANYAIIPSFGDIYRHLSYGQDECSRLCRFLVIVRTFINVFKELDAIVAWHPFDEPQDQISGLEILEILYHQIKATDPDRPVFFSLSTDELTEKYAPNSNDMVMFHHYPYPTSPVARNLAGAQYYLRLGNKWADEQKKPLFTWLSINEGADVNWIRLYRPKELRCQIFLDLAEGSRGLFLYNGPPPSKILWDSFKAYIEQVEAILPALFCPYLYSPINLNPKLPVIMKVVQPGELRARLSFYVGKMQDRAICIVVNPTSDSCRVTFSLNKKLKLGFPFKQVNVLFENRKLSIGTDNTFSDTFQDYDVHVYSFKCKLNP